MHAPSSKLTALELKLLNASFQPEHVSRHISSILASSALAACAVVAFAVYGLSAPAFGAVTGAVLAIGTLEKIVSQRKLVHYEALVRKLREPDRRVGRSSDYPRSRTSSSASV